MLPDDLVQRARAQSTAVPPSGNADAALEKLRTECASFFDEVPEPPLYRRADDPAKKAAEQLLERASALLARGFALEREAAVAPAAKVLVAALLANGESLCHVAGGRY